MPLGPRKGPIYTLFSLKSPGRQTPSGFPDKGPMERYTCLQGILRISQKPHILGSPIKEPSPMSPSWNPSHRDAPFLKPSFIHLPKTRFNEPPTPDSRLPSVVKGPLLTVNICVVETPN